MEQIAVRTAADLASGALKNEKKAKPLTDRLLNSALNIGLVKDQLFSKAQAQVMKQTNGLYPAPLRILKGENIQIITIEYFHLHF